MNHTLVARRLIFGASVAALVACGSDAAPTSTMIPMPPVAISPVVPVPTPTVHDFDLGRDFSFTANPAGPWGYGYTRTPGLGEIAASTFATTDMAPLGFWHPAAGASNYYPYIAANTGKAVTVDATGSWALRPGEVALEGSNTGQSAVITFTAPRAGRYAIAATFAGIHKRLSTTYVYVVFEDGAVFTGEIEGYGGDPSFFPVQGAHPTARYEGTRELRGGDVLGFAVDFGANRTHYNDTTGLTVTIQSTSPAP